MADKLGFGKSAVRIADIFPRTIINLSEIEAAGKTLFTISVSIIVRNYISIRSVNKELLSFIY